MENNVGFYETFGFDKSYVPKLSKHKCKCKECSFKTGMLYDDLCFTCSLKSKLNEKNKILDIPNFN